MKIYHYNPTTLEYFKEGVADQNPLEEGNWLIPAYATTVAPLLPQENKTVNFENSQWVYKDIPQPEPKLEPKQVELTYAEKRVLEYPDFREYLDSIVKGDVAQQQAYIDACLAVKAKYPK